MRGTLVMIMAGGKGSRLGPLTCHRAKPAVPFGGRYRIIDFVLSNFVNSGYSRIYVLTQYMAHSLISHLNANWHVSGFDGFIQMAPAQMRMGEYWYRGTADSIRQNLNLVFDSGAEHVAVFGGDHVYMFDVNQMEIQHRDTRADLTVAACPVPIREARQFGIIQVDENWKIIGFQEKPSNPSPIPGRPDEALASMGNYIFRAAGLEEVLLDDSGDVDQTHDFGKDIIPEMLDGGASIYAYDYGQNEIPDQPMDRGPYWRDVGTIDSYIAANMDVRARHPMLNLYNRRWRVRSASRSYPPARFVHEAGGPVSLLVDTMVCEGSIVFNAELRETLIGYDCFVHAGSQLSEVILLAGCDVGRDCRLRRVLADKNCLIAPGAAIGLDPAADRQRFPWISPSGFVILPKGTYVPREGPLEFPQDMAYMLRNDPILGPDLATMPDCFVEADRSRHSDESAGPRYHRVTATRTM